MKTQSSKVLGQMICVKSVQCSAVVHATCELVPAVGYPINNSGTEA